MRWSVCVVVVGARVGFRRMMRGRDPFRSAELIGYDVSRYRYGGWGSGDAWGSRRTSPWARGSARDAMRRGRWRQNHAGSPTRRGRHERSGTRAGRRRVDEGDGNPGRRLIIISHLNLVAADGDAGDGLAGGDALGLLAEAGHGGSRDGGGEHRCGRHGSLLTPVLVGGLQL